MPFIISHILYACRKHPVSVWNPTFFLGAQGPDPYFYALRPHATRTGRNLHLLSTESIHESLSECPDSFRLGFLSHLECDDLMHPYIRQATRDGLTHTQLEVTLDDQLSREFFGFSLVNLPLWDMIRSPRLPAIARAMDRLMNDNGIPCSLPYEKAVNKMILHLKLLYKYPSFSRNFTRLVKVFWRDFGFMYPDLDAFPMEVQRPYLEHFRELLISDNEK